MVGNMGSDTRFDYTAMGDTVNLASRLEGQSSTYGKTVIMAAETARLVGQDFATLEVDLVRLKGKLQAEHVFALLGGKDLLANPRFAAIQTCNSEMLQAYRDQDWGSAKAALDRLATLGGVAPFDLTIHIANHRARIAAFEKTPPPPEWDGVHDATSK
jgi:adenylate cyclase